MFRSLYTAVVSQGACLSAPIFVALFLWLIPVALIGLGWQLPGVTHLSINGRADADLLHGFYELEQNATEMYRWSQPEATLILPAQHVPGILELRGTVAPDGTRVTVSLNEQDALELPVASGAPALRRYQMLWRAAVDARGEVRLGINAHLPEKTIEARPIGLALTAVRVQSVGREMRLPPLLPLVVLGLVAPLLGASLRLGGMPWWISLGMSLIAGCLLASLWLWQPLVVRPFLDDVDALLHTGAIWRWWLAIQVIGLVVLPLLFSSFRHLPLYGYPFAKTLGVLLVGYGSWLLAMLHLLPFALPGMLLVVVLLATVSGWRLLVDWRLFVAALRQHWRAFLACELLFTLALCAGVWLRWHGGVGPAIMGTEKPMELALLAGLLRSPSFPPQDPWFAGYPMNYYYMGYVLLAVPQLLSGVRLGEAFNLGMATIFALTALTIAGLVVTLIGLSQRTVPQQGRSHARLGSTLAALLGVLLVLGVGNQMGALQLLFGSTQVRTLDGGQLVVSLAQRLRGTQILHLEQASVGSEQQDAFAAIRPIEGHAFDWWSPSRAIWDAVSLPDGTVERRQLITEFPFFSFYLGDLHPHVIALPFAALGVFLTLAMLVRPTQPGVWHNVRWIETALAGLLAGMLYAINAWYAPTFLLLYAGALALRSRRLAGPRWLTGWRGYLPDLVGLLLAMLLLIAPFLRSFQPPGGTQPVPEPWSQLPVVRGLAQTFAFTSNHTRLYAFLVIFGLFFSILLAYALTLHLSRRWLWGIPGAVLLVGMLVGFPLLALLPTALLLAWSAWHAADDPVRALVLWATAVGALVLFGVDIIYIRDYLEGDISRLNTLFKFYYQVWLLWGILAAYAVWALLQAPLRQWGVTLAWIIPTGLLLLGALVYPVGTLGWGDPWGQRGRTLDGLAFLHDQAPDELAAMHWLQTHTDSDAILLTAFCNCDYDQIGRVSSVTGQPTLLGWSFAHQTLWRSGIPAHLAEIQAREQDIPRIYTTVDINEARQLLAHYQVDYVYVGPTERRLYAGPGLAKFDTFLEPVFVQGSVTIYRVI